MLAPRCEPEPEAESPAAQNLLAATVRKRKRKRKKKKEGPDKKSAENAETRREALELAPSAGRMPRLPCWNAALSLSQELRCGGCCSVLLSLRFLLVNVLDFSRQFLDVPE